MINLVKRKNLVIEKIIDKNIYILLGYLKKGKEVNKIYFRFVDIISSSAFLFHSNIGELLSLMSKSKNRFFLTYFLKFLARVY